MNKAVNKWLLVCVAFRSPTRITCCRQQISVLFPTVKSLPALILKVYNFRGRVRKHLISLLVNLQGVDPPNVLGDGVCKYVWNFVTFLPNYTSYLGRQQSFLSVQKLVFLTHGFEDIQEEWKYSSTRVLNLCTIWRWVGSLASRPL